MLKETSGDIQTDSEIGTREDLDKVIEAVGNLQHQVLTLGLERESIRRLEEMKKFSPVSQSQELYNTQGDRQAADFGSVVHQH